MSGESCELAGRRLTQYTVSHGRSSGHVRWCAVSHWEVVCRIGALHQLTVLRAALLRCEYVVRSAHCQYGRARLNMDASLISDQLRSPLPTLLGSACVHLLLCKPSIVTNCTRYLATSLLIMHRVFSLCLLALCVSLLSCSVTADVPADLIASIPGFGKTPTKQYSGLLPADANNTVFLHYWFVTSSGNPTTDPVVVWMNGGPGCSSLEGGLYELGPFTFTGAEVNGVPTLVLNPNAWTTVASVLFLEQPAGVGFSYAVNGSTTSDDYIQSQNTYGFLLSFFAAYPEFAKNDFYVTGESYAGIYVPTLTYRIYEGNKAGNAHINIKGAAIGNGCWGDEIGTCSSSPDSTRIALTFYYGHGMVSHAAWDAMIATCGPSFNSSSDACDQAINNAIDNVGNIDVYNGETTAPHTAHATDACYTRGSLSSCRFLSTVV